MRLPRPAFAVLAMTASGMSCGFTRLPRYAYAPLAMTCGNNFSGKYPLCHCEEALADEAISVTYVAACTDICRKETRKG